MARRCSQCDIDFPDDKELCPVCSSETWEHKGSHDRDWREQVARLQKRVKPGRLIPNAVIEILNKDGRRFVRDKEIRDAGYVDIQSGDIVLVRGYFFEVYGAVKDKDILGWWIELIPTHESYDLPHPVMTEYEYKQLEKRRGRR